MKSWLVLNFIPIYSEYGWWWLVLSVPAQSTKDNSCVYKLWRESYKQKMKEGICPSTSASWFGWSQGRSPSSLSLALVLASIEAADAAPLWNYCLKTGQGKFFFGECLKPGVLSRAEVVWHLCSFPCSWLCGSLSRSWNICCQISAPKGCWKGWLAVILGNIFAHRIIE